MSQLVTVKSDNHLSRETVKLLVDMKHLLKQHGITIKLADPNVVSHVLQAAESINDDAIRQGRKRLQALNPHAERPNRVYLFSSSIGRVTCGQCRKAMNVQIHPQAGILNPQVTTCECGEILHIGKQTRQYARKPTQLEGTFALERDDNIIGEMIVENISYDGVRLRVKSCGGNIYRDDVLLIQFSLDNKHRTIIREPIDVRYIQDGIIGAQFQNAYGMPKPLVEYLRS
ncbi:hypothetical protein [Candidatus Entotheonella palauensis]|uniref:hypothetical protein n=1 Tax=Candidatus Entotheonella palauensis TaxID=93172 RepID=UPI000B7E710B|nr:hypothetical protein [Candidatus Entotheonella palauensis]